MCASLRDVLRARGKITLEFVEQLLQEHEELTEMVRRLKRREVELKERLEAEMLHRQELESRAREREKELADLRKRLEAHIDQGAATGGADSDELRGRLEKRIESLLGDLDRLRRRAEAASSEARRDERNRLLAAMGQVFDSVERAIAMSEGPWREGLEAIEGQFIKFLKEEGVTLIDAVGVPMDPWIHNAVDQVRHPDFEKGQVVEVRRVGFKLDDGAVLRPAEVVVAG